MDLIEVCRGVWLVNIPEVALSVLCGCPPDVTKHLMRRGLITERQWAGGTYENGPNAILLSERPIQGGKLANLAEFPILQMFYRQGMIIPGHPGNTGRKPLIIGMENQLHALGEYLFRGTYGLANLEEIMACGIKKEFAEEILRIKLDFAFGSMRKSSDILDYCPMDSGQAEPVPGLSIKRDDVNQYTFTYQGQSITVDLDLPPGKTYPAAITLGFHRIHHHYFSVLHLGEGDGWDIHRPCMSSVVMFQGKIYLIDTGPNILASLTAAGISVNEIEGIFHTHAHDDHFAGLTSLARTDHRIKHYATPLVRATIMKKLAAVMGLPESHFIRSFEVHDLHFNRWNNLSGLEVMPVFSPHPVETTVLYFRTPWAGGFKTYAHLSDISSFEVLEKQLLKVPGHTKLSERLYERFMHMLKLPVDLKKIDVGGGMIHGQAQDFANDGSEKIVLAHLARGLSTEEKQIGSESSFGTEDVLIPANMDYVRNQASRYIKAYFPEAPEWDVAMLLNCQMVSHHAGYILQKKDHPIRSIYLVINGVAEIIPSDENQVYMQSAGTILGELAFFNRALSTETWRAKSYINVLEIPPELCLIFLNRNGDSRAIQALVTISRYLQRTHLFGEMVSSLVLTRVSRSVRVRCFETGEIVTNPRRPSLIIIRAGKVELSIDGEVVDIIGPGQFFGEESLFYSTGNLISAKALAPSECWYIAGSSLRDVPIVEWKMLEIYEQRLTAFARTQR